MVTVPNAASAASKARFMAARSSTSASTAMARPPAASIRDFIPASRSRRRATRATAAPLAASTSAKRAPRPLDAPVTPSRNFALREKYLYEGDASEFVHDRQDVRRQDSRHCPDRLSGGRQDD